MTEPKGDLDRTRTTEQRAAYETTVGKGVCPFCGKVSEMPVEIRTRMIHQGAYWRAWHNPFPYPGHAAHIVLAPIEHWTQPSDVTPEAAREWMELNAHLIKTLNLPGGGIVMRFGDHEYKGGSITHLHSHIQVPDRSTFSLAVFYANESLLEFFKNAK
ncbi:MAG TPA: hypothetical protein VEB18_02245 [Candidatus Paceibacterota bacterium]|nr:hypothetical protein [Candidatus Paceibacterota bacterium]